MALRYAVQELDIVKSWKGLTANGNKNDNNDTKPGPDTEREEDTNESAVTWARFVVALNREARKKDDETASAAAAETTTTSNKLQSSDEDCNGGECRCPVHVIGRF